MAKYDITFEVDFNDTKFLKRIDEAKARIEEIEAEMQKLAKETLAYSEAGKKIPEQLLARQTKIAEERRQLQELVKAYDVIGHKLLAIVKRWTDLEKATKQTFADTLKLQKLGLKEYEKAEQYINKRYKERNRDKLKALELQLAKVRDLMLAEGNMLKYGKEYAKIKEEYSKALASSVSQKSITAQDQIARSTRLQRQELAMTQKLARQIEKDFGSQKKQIAEARKQEKERLEVLREENKKIRFQTQLVQGTNREKRKAYLQELQAQKELYAMTLASAKRKRKGEEIYHIKPIIEEKLKEGYMQGLITKPEYIKEVRRLERVTNGTLDSIYKSLERVDDATLRFRLNLVKASKAMEASQTKEALNILKDQLRYQLEEARLAKDNTVLMRGYGETKLKYIREVEKAYKSGLITEREYLNFIKQIEVMQKRVTQAVTQRNLRDKTKDIILSFRDLKLEMRKVIREGIEISKPVEAIIANLTNMHKAYIAQLDKAYKQGALSRKEYAIKVKEADEELLKATSNVYKRYSQSSKLAMEKATEAHKRNMQRIKQDMQILNQMLQAGDISPFFAKLKFKKLLYEYQTALNRVYEGIPDRANVVKSAMAQATAQFDLAYKSVKRWDSKIVEWWHRFGLVALGFTVMYRAMVGIENIFRAVTGAIVDAIRNFDTLQETVVKTSIFYKLFSRNSLSFSEAMNSAKSSVNGLQIAMINSISPAEDLTQMLDELAQHGVAVSASMMPAFINLADFIGMIAKTSTSMANQIRQEIQALFEGTARAGNTLLRLMKNMESAKLIPAGTVERLRNMSDALEQVKEIVKVINPVMAEMKKHIFEVSSTSAKNRLLNVLNVYTAIASQIAGQRLGVKNVFANVFNKASAQLINLGALDEYTTALKLYEKALATNSEKVDEFRKNYEQAWNKLFNEKQRTNIIQFSYGLEFFAKVLEKIVSFGIGFVTFVGQITTYFQTLNSQTKENIKTFAKFIATLFGFKLAKGIVKFVAGEFIALFAIIIKGATGSVRKLLLVGTAIKYMGNMFMLARKDIKSAVKVISKSFDGLNKRMLLISGSIATITTLLYLGSLAFRRLSGDTRTYAQILKDDLQAVITFVSKGFDIVGDKLKALYDKMLNQKPTNYGVFGVPEIAPSPDLISGGTSREWKDLVNNLKAVYDYEEKLIRFKRKTREISEASMLQQLISLWSKYASVLKDRIAPELENLNKQQSMVQKRINETKDLLNGAVESYQLVSEKLNEAKASGSSKNIEKWANKLSQAKDKVEELKLRLMDLYAQLDSIKQSKVTIQTEGLDITQKLYDLQDKLKKYRFGLTQGLKEGYYEFVNSLQTTFEAGETYMKNFADNTVKMLDDTLFNVLTGRFDNLKDVIRSFVNSMLQEVSKLLVKMALTKAMDTFGGNKVKGVTAPKIEVPKLSYNTQGASGLVVDKPTIALIGEASQREAVIPLPNGQDVPVELRNKNKVGEPQSVNINVNPSIVVKAFSPADIESVSGHIKEIINRTMLENVDIINIVRSRL